MLNMNNSLSRTKTLLMSLWTCHPQKVLCGLGSKTWIIISPPSVTTCQPPFKTNPQAMYLDTRVNASWCKVSSDRVLGSFGPFCCWTMDVQWTWSWFHMSLRLMSTLLVFTYFTHLCVYPLKRISCYMARNWFPVENMTLCRFMWDVTKVFWGWRLRVECVFLDV